MVGSAKLEPQIYTILREKISSSSSSFKKERLEALNYFETTEFQKEKDSPIVGFYTDYNALPYSLINPEFKDEKEFVFGKIIPLNENRIISFNYSICNYVIVDLTKDGVYDYVQKNDFEHVLFRVKPGVKADLKIERIGSRSFTIFISEFLLEENSSLNVLDVQEYSGDSKSYSFKRFDLKENARNQCFSYEKSSKWSVNTIEHYFTGKNSKAVNYSVFIAEDNAHTDFKSNSFHFVPDTTNEILNKGLCNNASQAVFRGLIKIHKEAPNTLSHLASHILLLDDKSKANALPSLEIDNNLVSSKHAAAVSNVDKQQKFYLNSRGFNDQEAEKLISRSFAFQVAVKLESPFKEKVISFLESKI